MHLELNDFYFLIKEGFVLRENKERFNVWKIFNTDIEIVSFPKNKLFYFVYFIKEPLSGCFYIGMKKVLPNTFKWKKYVGSSSEWRSFLLKNEVNKLEKYILAITTSRYTAKYYEVKYIMRYGGIENNLIFNRNILGRFFYKKVFTGDYYVFEK